MYAKTQMNTNITEYAFKSRFFPHTFFLLKSVKGDDNHLFSFFSETSLKVSFYITLWI